uniref:Olfactory receptor n=1 Tax=Oncorhynchus mykiss TaxID=8022 RepID=A0A8C7TXD9_ONCMY
MENSTQVKLFYLFGLQETFNNKSVYFTLSLITYLLIITVNLTLIITIIQQKGLHEPMYIFLCSLCVNGLYGTAGFYPKFLLDLQSDVQGISYGGCLTQTYVIYTSVMCEMSTLTVMSYDRYVAICRPLLYHTIYNNIMTLNRVCILICVIWLYSFAKSIKTLTLTIRLGLCVNVIDKVYCDNYLVVKLACSTSDTTVNKIYGLCGIVLSVPVPLITIVLSYIKILTICLNSSIETRQKAFSTCSPHLASLLNFSFGCFLTLLQSRFDSPMRNVPTVLHTFLSVYYLMLLYKLLLLLFNLKKKVN